MTFTLPAEWSRQSAVLLTWPHVHTDWRPILNDIEYVYLELAKSITQYQKLVIACHDERIKLRVTELLCDEDVDMHNVRLFIAPCNDTWARDHGPITLVNRQNDRQLKVLDFTFNAWGDKYSGELDNEITGHLMSQPFAHSDVIESSDFILEGGSIESDGNGVLMTTTRCLLNPNRNLHLSKEQIEQTLVQNLGVNKVLWLEYGYLSGDDTDAHIDTLARFAPEGIVYVSCRDENDPHFQELNKMEDELKGFTDVEGTPYQLFALPMPKPIFDDDGEPLPATYANYLIINGAVLVPTYNDVADKQALAIIGAAHPGRKIIGIDCRAVIKQFGSLHCLTMQLPAGLIS